MTDSSPGRHLYQPNRLVRYKENDIVGKWPKEVRNDLRAAVKAKHKGDWRMAASLFER